MEINRFECVQTDKKIQQIFCFREHVELFADYGMNRIQKHFPFFFFSFFAFMIDSLSSH